MVRETLKTFVFLIIIAGISLCVILPTHSSTISHSMVEERLSVSLEHNPKQPDQQYNPIDGHFLGLSTEKYSSPHWEDNGYVGFTTYRVYACFYGVINDYLAVFGGFNDTLTVYSTDGVFYNDLTYPSIRPPEDHTEPPEEYYANLWDTYVTMDCALNCESVPSFAPSEEVFAQLTNDLSGNFTLYGDAAGAWFSFLGGIVPPPANILIAQFTVAEGERIGGYLNIQDYEGQIYLNVPFGLELADVNHDTYVDVLDLLEVLAHWGEIGGPADVNNDGIVDMLDILVVLAHWS